MCLHSGIAIVGGLHRLTVSKARNRPCYNRIQETARSVYRFRTIFALRHRADFRGELLPRSGTVFEAFTGRRIPFQARHFTTRFGVYPASEKLEIIRLVEQSHLPVR